MVTTMKQVNVEEFIGKFIGYYAEELEKDVTNDAVVVNKNTIKALKKVHSDLTEVEAEDLPVDKRLAEPIETYQEFVSPDGKKTSTNVNKGKMIAYVNQFPEGIYKNEIIAKFENNFADASSCSCSLNATVKEGFLEMSSTKPFVVYPSGKRGEAIAKQFHPVKYFNGVEKKSD